MWLLVSDWLATPALASPIESVQSAHRYLFPCVLYTVNTLASPIESVQSAHRYLFPCVLYTVNTLASPIEGVQSAHRDLFPCVLYTVTLSNSCMLELYLTATRFFFVHNCLLTVY